MRHARARARAHIGETSKRMCLELLGTMQQQQQCNIQGRTSLTLAEPEQLTQLLPPRLHYCGGATAAANAFAARMLTIGSLLRACIPIGHGPSGGGWGISVALKCAGTGTPCPRLLGNSAARPRAQACVERPAPSISP